MMVVTPRPAASVILVRETDARSEALLVRKHASLDFAGGTFVFPGGKIERSDVLPDQLYRGMRARSERHRAHITALCRETFEEIGVVLARHADGSHCEAALVDELGRYRKEIDREPSLFADFLRDNGLFIHEEDFLYWANWITPSLWPKRFDAHFYVARMPQDQQVKCDTAEATELKWLDLADFNEVDGAAIIPAAPTLLSLTDLAIRCRELGSLDDVLREERNRQIPRIMPKMVEQGEAVVSLMPWHRDYAAAPGEGVEACAVPDFYHAFSAREVWQP